MSEQSAFERAFRHLYESQENYEFDSGLRREGWNAALDEAVMVARAHYITDTDRQCAEEIEKLKTDKIKDDYLDRYYNEGGQ